MKVISNVFDSILHKHLRNGLNKFPNLQSIFPADWPKTKKYYISNKFMRDFQKTRRKENLLDNMNFPLMLYNYNKFNAPQKSKQVFYSILENLEIFAKEMKTYPGFKDVLTPLWDEFENPKRFWAVVSEVYFCNFIVHRGFEIKGFERKIPNSTKKADILTSWNDVPTYVDIEACSLTKEIEGDDIKFRELIVHRAKNKMESKFNLLKRSNYGIVSSIYRIDKPSLLDRFKTGTKELHIVIDESNPNVFAHVYWLIVGKRSNEPYKLYLVDNEVEMIKIKE